MKTSKFFLLPSILLILGIVVFTMYQCKKPDNGITTEEKREISATAKKVLTQLSDEEKATKESK